ncbi:MAG: hypothetical protein KAQ75_01435, partial [Bacteroidales bacterium]|nr:hypothetical protein [Bacteroidales bacterium]
MNSFSRYYAAFLCAIFIIRIVETIFILNKILIDSNISYLFISGLIADLAGASYIASIMLVVALVLPVQKSSHKYLLHIIPLSFILIQYATVQFFVSALVPLDHSLFTYSVQEIVITIKSTDVSVFSHIILVILIAFYFLAFKYMPKRKQFYLVSLPIQLICVFI